MSSDDAGTASDGPRPRGTAGRRRSRLPALLDQAFFVLGGVAAVLLAVVLVTDGVGSGWFQIAFYLAVWALVAYLALPRLHRILTRLYVPDYFIGRARTSDGLLGDPVNLALQGSDAQLLHAMTSAGWTRADDVTLRTSWRIVTSTLTRRSYHRAPVSPLFVFGRQQDVAFQQEVAGNPAKRHHVRFWRCPEGWLLPGGFPVEWVAAGTFDRSVGLSLFTLQVTHRISPDTDRERDHIVETVRARHPEATVDVIRDFSTGYHSRNGGGDSIVTDGDLPILDLRAIVVPPGSQLEPITAAPATELTARKGAPRATALRRPATTHVGALMLVARGLAYALQAALLITGVSALGDFTPLDGDTATVDGVALDDEATTVVAVALLLAAMLLWLVLGGLVLHGSGTARLLALTSSVLSTLTAFSSVLEGGAPISLQTNLVSVAFDVLVLLALSSRSSRDYAAARSRARASRRLEARRSRAERRTRTAT